MDELRTEQNWKPVGTPQGGWCSGTHEPGCPPLVGTLHAWEPIGDGWTRCGRCGARQRVPHAPADGHSTAQLAETIRALTEALTATRDRLAATHETARAGAHERDRMGRELLDLQRELDREREERRRYAKRVSKLEADSGEQEAIRMRVAWANRLLFFLTLLGFMGLWKLKAWLF